MNTSTATRPSALYGFRDRWGHSRALSRLVKAIEAFDRFTPQTEHMCLTIELPSAFFRYAMTECMPYRDWGVLRATLDYGCHRIEIKINVAEQSHITYDIKATRYLVDEGEGYAWYRLEQSAPLRLSLADAQRFVIFLMNHFLCFDLTITTRLSK
ncbi:MAG: hypothetical protein IDH49_08610 [Gammaproteobacteria bacterium]|nr:hypothetical protein [Gammaproteobacteria bacterium]